MPTPEELARQNIDVLLLKCGWIIQDYKKLDLSAGRGVAIREVPLQQGRCDYLLLIDRKPVGIRLSVVEQLETSLLIVSDALHKPMVRP